MDTKTMTKIDELLQTIDVLSARIDAIEAKLNEPKVSPTEMTDDDAKRILTGDLKDASHKIAAATMGLTYGQVYSARKGFTFKHVVKALKDAGEKSQWF